MSFFFLIVLVTHLCVCACVHACTCGNTCAEAEVDIGVLLNCSPSYTLRRGHSDEFRAHDMTGPASCLAPGTPSLCFLIAGITGRSLCSPAVTGSGDLNSTPHARPALPSSLSCRLSSPHSVSVSICPLGFPAPLLSLSRPALPLEGSWKGAWDTVLIQARRRRGCL